MAAYTLGADPDQKQGVSHAWCMTCGMRSLETEEKGALQVWCFQHTAETGHARFRGVVTTFLVVTLNPAQPVPHNVT
ncbi:DUF7848 domain-containing protein [Streptomyces bauhiniae]